MKNLLKVNLSSLLILGLFAFMPELYGQQKETEMRALTESSDLIVVGKVLNTKAEWGVDKKGIYTDVTIEVDEYLKGQESESTITVRHPGGEVGEVGELYTHMPSFKKEEEMVLFVKKNNYDGKYRVYDGANGKIEIIKNKASGEQYTTSNKKVADLKKQIKSYQKEK